jgi:hypothetical protein
MNIDFTNEFLCDFVDDRVERLLSELRWIKPPVDAKAIVLRDRRFRQCEAEGWSARRRGRAGMQHKENAEFVAQRNAARSIARVLLRELCKTCCAAAQAGGENMPFIDVFAARLLIPTRWFCEDVRHLGYHLVRLQERYATASPAQVAWRLLDLDRGLVVTTFDSNHLVSRRANFSGLEVPQVDVAERAAQSYAHQYGRPRLEHSARASAWAWPQHEPDWRREIVLAQFDADFCGHGS